MQQILFLKMQSQTPITDVSAVTLTYMGIIISHICKPNKITME